MRNLLCLLVLLLTSVQETLAAPVLGAENPLPEMWPGAVYDPSIPTYEQVLGYPVGARISRYEDMLRFFTALQAAAPARLKLIDYGKTWEGRRLVYAVIGNAETITRLDQITTDMQRLADPRITDLAAASQLIASLPASIWLAYGIHGNEISSTDAAMLTAYHLLAANDETVSLKVADNSLVFIDPLQNPDGRARFTQHYYSSVGLQDSPDRISAEHDEPWPGGRTNHYLFDLNRDWLALTQPETQSRVLALNKHLPLVVIDFHEMGGDESYYFAPAADPINPHMTPQQSQQMLRIGKRNAYYFDQRGFDYFTHEIFDAFYPGYTDSWPTFYGASASTYEAGSARGMVYRRADGELLTYRETIRKHFTASLSTLETAADNRNSLLTDFYQIQVDAIDIGKNNKQQRFYIFPNNRDKAGNDRLASLLTEHGIEVRQAKEAFKACGISYAAGARFIDTAQPRGRLATTLLSQQVDMDAPFLAEQERRRTHNLDNQIYDTTAWSLPLLFNIDIASCTKVSDLPSMAFTSAQSRQGQVIHPEATVAFLVPWGDMAAGRFLSAALLAGITVKSADEAFTMANNTRYPAGTLIIEKRSNSADIHRVLTTLAANSGAQVIGVDDSWVEQGPSFGSSNTLTLSAPAIAMAWDEPTYSNSAGSTRFVIERQLNYPVTAIRSSQLQRANLNQYQVLILPAGNYATTLGKAGADNLRDWVKQGGVLITLSSATAYAASTEAGLLDIKREDAYQAATDEPDEQTEDTRPGSLLDTDDALRLAITSAGQKPDYVPGILANITIDTHHWLTAGVHTSLVGMVQGNAIYAPIKLASGNNIAWFSGADELLASGYLWQENRQQLARKPFMVQQPMGRGMVIGFTQEPTYRAYLEGLNVLLMNSLFRAPAHASPAF